MADEFPIGHQIGAYTDIWHDIGGWERLNWWCQFGWEGGKWSATFLQDKDILVPELTGHGDTPREAFESLVRIWTFANGGEPSLVLKEHLEGMRSIFFKEDGSVRDPDTIESRRV